MADGILHNAEFFILTFSCGARERSVPLRGMKTTVKYHIPLLPLWGMKAMERISQALASSPSAEESSRIVGCYS